MRIAEAHAAEKLRLFHLRVRLIDSRMRLLGQTPCFTSSTTPIIVRQSSCSGLGWSSSVMRCPHGIAAGPESSRHTLADDHDTGRGGVVLAAKGSATQQWHSHHAEVFRAHGGLIHQVATQHRAPAIEMKVSLGSTHR